MYLYFLVATNFIRDVLHLPNYMQLVNGASSTARLIVLPGAALGAGCRQLVAEFLIIWGQNCCLPEARSSLSVWRYLRFCLNIKDSLIIDYVFYMFGIGLIFGNVMTNGCNLKNTQQTMEMPF